MYLFILYVTINVERYIHNIYIYPLIISIKRVFVHFSNSLKK